MNFQNTGNISEIWKILINKKSKNFLFSYGWSEIFGQIQHVEKLDFLKFLIYYLSKYGKEQ